MGILLLNVLVALVLEEKDVRASKRTLVEFDIFELFTAIEMATELPLSLRFVVLVDGTDPVEHFLLHRCTFLLLDHYYLWLIIRAKKSVRDLRGRFTLQNRLARTRYFAILKIFGKRTHCSWDVVASWAWVIQLPELVISFGFSKRDERTFIFRQL